MASEPVTPARLSLDQLASLAGLTARTVRFYIQLGLVDRPQGEKRGAHYVSRHLEQLLQVRRWTEAGLSLERIGELRAGAPDEPAPRPSRPGSVEVWSRVTLADGLEIHVEPGRAGLAPEQMRSLVRHVTQAYRALLAEGQGGSGTAGLPHAAPPDVPASPNTDGREPHTP
jgi:DNA-binding transcriptional MerR regulator